MKEKILNFLSQYVTNTLIIVVTVIIFLVLSPGDTVSVKTFLWFVIPLTVYVVITFPELIKYWLAPSNGILLPQLKLIKDNYFIFSPSPLFSSQSAVSIYFKDDIEQYIGYGKIDTVISGTNNLQVLVIDIEENFSKTELMQNKKNIIIKPMMPYEQIEKINNKGAK